MTAKIPRSKIGDPSAFKTAVEAHAADLRAFEAQRLAVERTKDLKADDPAKATLYPPPGAHPLIDQAVGRPTLAPDYEIVEDGVALAQKKLAHLHALTTAELEALERVRPALKRRLDAIVHAELTAKVRIAQDGSVKDGRSSKEQATCDEHLEREERIARIERRAAEAQAELADLDDSNIDGWSVPDLEKAG